MTTVCGRPSDFPQLGLGCCWGDIMRDRCTCWEPEYDIPQAAPRPDLVATLGPDGGCHDCAYRPDSPEKNGDPLVNGDAEELERLVRDGHPFTCHQGMRRPVRYRHPSGAVHVPPGAEHAYDPPQGDDGRYYKADGTPADICSGWAARRLTYLRTEEPYDEASA